VINIFKTLNAQMCSTDIYTIISDLIFLLFWSARDQHQGIKQSNRA
jgi:hypothetical protein